jgi:hypothetical protein
VYEFETITYSPLNTPVLDLSNDTASLVYSADNIKLGDETISSTATLYLNGEEVENVSYAWLLDNCTTSATQTDNNTHLLTNTIDINDITAPSGTATCYAFKAFKDKEISAVVVKNCSTDD